MSEQKPAEQAVEYLQTAALEAIRAVRSFLDIAESLVREPETAAIVGKAFAEAAASVLRPATSERDARDGEGRDEGTAHEDTRAGRVRRIDVD